MWPRPHGSSMSCGNWPGPCIDAARGGAWRVRSAKRGLGESIMKGMDGVGSDSNAIERVRALCDRTGVMIRRCGTGYELRGRNVHLVVADLRQIEESDVVAARDEDAN